MNIEQVAQICHETNRAYCATIGDNTQTSWEDAPDWQKISAKRGVEFHLATLNQGSEPTAAASHESWLREKKADGWKYGPVKDAEKKEHPCFVPYNELPPEQRMKDYLFVAVVSAFYEVETKTKVVR